jgi:hypothetical protein
VLTCKIDLQAQSFIAVFVQKRFGKAEVCLVFADLSAYKHRIFYTKGIQKKTIALFSACIYSTSHPKGEADGFSADAVENANNRTPLILCACRRQRPAILEALLSAGGDPTRRDKRGLNAIDLAAAQNDCIAMQMLLAALPEDTAQNIVSALAPNLPLSDDNQAMLGILKKYL